MQLLIENISPVQANLVESQDGSGNYYMSGICMQADVLNGNKRVYPLAEITKAVEFAKTKIAEGNYIMGELNHPDVLTINPYNASHAIVSMGMDGSNAVGKLRLLNTPAGNIAKAIMEGGVRLGVSSRGTGSVDGSGKVSGFNFVTIDIVSQPSGPNCYPNMVREAQEDTRIVSLAEAVCHDDAAQKYLKAELRKFISSLLK